MRQNISITMTTSPKLPNYSVDINKVIKDTQPEVETTKRKFEDDEGVTTGSVSTTLPDTKAKDRAKAVLDTTPGMLDALIGHGVATDEASAIDLYGKTLSRQC